MLDKYVGRGFRTASRIWGGIAVVILLPKRNVNLEEVVFELGSDGSYIWKLLEEKPTLRKIIVSFAKRKKIRFDVAHKEVARFIKQLAAKNLVEVLDKKETG
jgi:hypothetical protein